MQGTLKAPYLAKPICNKHLPQLKLMESVQPIGGLDAMACVKRALHGRTDLNSELEPLH